MPTKKTTRLRAQLSLSLQHTKLMVVQARTARCTRCPRFLFFFFLTGLGEREGAQLNYSIRDGDDADAESNHERGHAR
jgi:hypothetical protein